MKKTGFESPSIDFISFEADDIVTTSGCEGVEKDENDEWSDIGWEDSTKGKKS